MTYKEYIALALNKFNITEDTVDLLLVNQEPLISNPEQEVDVKKAKTAICNEFAALIPIWSQMSEGGSSVSLNMDAIKMWYKQLCDELGIVPITEIVVKNVSDAW